MTNSNWLPVEREVFRQRCIRSHLDFTRYFFKFRENIKFRINWHHLYLTDELQKVIDGETENLIINVPPGSSKTEIAVINLIARGLALNPRSRFLHISYSDDLALRNSQTARNIVTSEEYQEFWPYQIAEDSKAKKSWNVMVDGRKAGGVYAVSLGGQITGFRAGHMAEGWQGAIVIDDPLKPEDAFSETKVNKANRSLLTTIKSRKANPKTPIILIMQRICQNDPTGFITAGNVPGKWKHVVIPSLLDAEAMKTIPKKYHDLIDDDIRDEMKRCSYWQYKEPIDELREMEAGSGTDKEGNRISRHVFAGQYQQNPVALGGNCIRGEWFTKYEILPKIKYRIIYGDTAQKVKEANDYSVFEEWGLGYDGKIYLIDMIRGKWEAPELKKRAIMFWNTCKARDTEKFGMLRQFKIEDKSSGTGLIQELKLAPHNIPVKGIPRNSGNDKTGHTNDKLTRVMDGQPYMEAGLVCLPLNAPFTHEFIAECEAFMPDFTHAHDDQIDPMVDAIKDMLSAGNKLKVWEELGKEGNKDGKDKK